jgi:hypothetical protein
MRKNKAGSLYQKSVYKNSTSFKRVDTDAEKLQEKIAKNEALSNVVSTPTIKYGTKEGDKYQKNTMGNKYVYKDEYYDTREDFEKAIAADKGMSLAEYRASKSTRKTGQSKQTNK